MNQFLIGALVLALAGLGVQTWRASSAGEEASLAKLQASLLDQQLVQQTAQASALQGRFDSFDAKLVLLAGVTEANGKLLTGAVDQLDNLKPQPEDTHETVNCARLPVPVDVDRVLRHGDPLPAR